MGKPDRLSVHNEMSAALVLTAGYDRGKVFQQLACKVIDRIDIITEFFGTAVNVLCLQTDLVELAGDLNMLDYDKLRKDMK